MTWASRKDQSRSVTATSRTQPALTSEKCTEWPPGDPSGGRSRSAHHQLRRPRVEGGPQRCEFPVVWTLGLSTLLGCRARKQQGRPAGASPVPRGNGGSLRGLRACNQAVRRDAAGPSMSLRRTVQREQTSRKNTRRL